MSETVFERSFSSLFEFLDAYRSDIKEGFLPVSAAGDFDSGARAAVNIYVPVFEEGTSVGAEIVDVREDGVILRLDQADEGYEWLTWLYGLCGKFIEEMLATGRFKIAGQMAAGGAGEGPGATMGSAAEDGIPFGAVPTESGDLDRDVFRRILMKAYAEQFLGVARIDHPMGTSSIFFERGGPVQVRDDPVVVDETLGVMLVRMGRITDAQFQQSLKVMNQTGKLQGEVLIDMGLLTFPVLVMALMRQCEMKVLRLFNNAEGSYATFPLERHSSKFVTPPLKAPATLYKAIGAHYGTIGREEMTDLQRPHLDQYSRVKIDFPIDDMQLKKTEVEFLEIVSRRNYRLRQIYSVSNLSRQPTASIVMTLMDMGILQFVDEEDTSQVMDNFRVQLTEKIVFMEDQNLFERLEIHWSGRPVDVDEGYERLNAQWQKFGTGYELAEELEELRNKVFGMLRDARDTLKTDEGRRGHRRKHYESQQIAFSADIFFRQAELLMISERWTEVVENMERSCELMPDNRKYQQALAKVRARRNL